MTLLQENLLPSFYLDDWAEINLCNHIHHVEEACIILLNKLHHASATHI